MVNVKKYIAYVLRDDCGRYYKGVTGCLDRRLAEHKSGHTITTSRMSNLSLVYAEGFESFAEARKRELYFKSAAGRRYLRSKILPM
ncbi:MAG: hypothetical protein A3H57_01535 [Candidatus Taylorbacteria bacterium RIFCSPLOWO2_02_FULL_43_11]|uniref:GIY-YIG domain-containing protein n=1 Tax=Candidatus Taylorbacteria bacterium RIFCSPHIGHO2_02_FULL_43_32b TaxID=1802306 RepID=A0A1G2ME48_9BACT|nr:MAG: hypothetical protein A2743_02805 [Candidatus Taylorbacteria bacterium RIFCSPHIGHO2_01_FULL_43_47]OHA22158.1 MAG: hypothetical protein A3C72_02275 [Candidatus Taylorbacteria bacterium RIFCSPHIGHO2_02_FULL_43_32b]OHA28854.1 MAG: hypothetical protein A3B08_02045 [Candidatus Taylorbacteria bacterium RIFCSPLOWO2_01_FULL_43_44]OHA36056.1 MAG: hypothetical protein A3H57_01535 [Candidatus Taylorbacteria bacterium RIFCSPLOWO2_02_FULL_43_11]